MLFIINIRNRVFSLLLFCLATFSGCTIESLITPSEAVGLYTITLSLDMAGNTDVLNRAVTYTDECRLDDVHLLLFGASSGYIDRYEGENLASGTDFDINKKTFKVDLPPGTYDILIVGNCRALLQSANLQTGQSRQAVATALKYQLEGHWGYDDPMIPLPFDPIPVYGEVLGVVADSNKTFSDIPVVRMTARIDVRLHEDFNTLQHGSLRSVRLYNSNTQGQIIPNAGTYMYEYNNLRVLDPSIPLTSTFAMPLYYRVPDPGEELTYTIYTPEAVRGSTDYLRNTCLVVGIGGSPDSGGATRAGNSDSTYYYRVDFRNDEHDQFLPILRNHIYTITIKDIYGPGFPDPDKAYRSEPYELNYEVMPWHTYNYYDPSIYRLDISQTWVETTLSNEWSEIYISTTHPEGWSAYVSDYPDRIERNPNPSLLLIEELLAFEEDWSTSYWGITEIEGVDSEKPFVFVIYTKEPTWIPRYEYATAYIHIVSGNLTNVITVKRQRVQDWN